MLKGLNVAKAGMVPRDRQLEVNANNLANINTIGYKKNNVFFRHLVKSIEAETQTSAEAAANSGEVITDYTAGPVRETGNPLDLSILGDGFFVIDTPDGEVYTRNGNFTMDANGKIITPDGYSVMGSGGEMQVLGEEIKISENGTLLVDGEPVDKIRLVSFADTGRLNKIGGSYFTDEADTAEDLDPDEIHLRQGYLEGSNVNGMEEIVKMIDMYRQFEMGQKAITTQDHTLDKLINDAGRV